MHGSENNYNMAAFGLAQALVMDFFSPHILDLAQALVQPPAF